MTEAADIHRPIVLSPVEMSRGVARDVYFLRREAQCAHCEGRGSLDGLTTCQICGGTGRARSLKSASVDLPPGLRPGQVVSIPGQGELFGADYGTLRLAIFMAPDSDMRVEGDDLYGVVGLSPYELRDGTIRSIETGSGAVDLQIPPASQDGAVLTVEGGGMTPLEPGGAPGNLYLTLEQVVGPTAASLLPTSTVTAERPRPAVERRPDIGAQLVREGRYEEALALLAPMAEAYPDDGEVWYRLGRARLAMGQWRAASGALSCAWRNCGYRTHNVHLAQAKAYLELGNVLGVCWQAELALQRSPGNARAQELLQRALADFLEGDPARRGWALEADIGRRALPEAQRRYYGVAAAEYESARRAHAAPSLLLYEGSLKLLEGLAYSDHSAAVNGLIALRSYAGQSTAGGDFHALLDELSSTYLATASQDGLLSLVQAYLDSGDARAAAELLADLLTPGALTLDARKCTTEGVQAIERIRETLAGDGQSMSAYGRLALGLTHLLLHRVYTIAYPGSSNLSLELLADAMQMLWAAAAERPDEPLFQEWLSATVEEFDQVATQVAAQTDPVRERFFQNTFSALARGVVPFSPLAGAAVQSLGAKGLMETYGWAYGVIFAQAAPTSQEFMVDAVWPFYALTNCRLLQWNYALNAYDLIPLCNVLSYQARQATKGAVDVDISLAGGGVVAYRGVAETGVAPEAAVHFVLNWRTWTGLTEHEQLHLAAGYGASDQVRAQLAAHREALALLPAADDRPTAQLVGERTWRLVQPGEQGPTPALPPARATCPACGATNPDSDTFCVRCGARLPAG